MAARISARDFPFTRDLYNQTIDINKKIGILSSLRSCMRLTLHNRGKEKIEAITVNAKRPSI
jgi:hypothetical protein